MISFPGSAMFKQGINEREELAHADCESDLGGLVFRE